MITCLFGGIMYKEENMVDLVEAGSGLRILNQVLTTDLYETTLNTTHDCKGESFKLQI